MSDVVANLSAEDKRRLIDRIVVAFLQRAGIAHTVEPTSAGMTLHIDLQTNLAIPDHLTHLAH
jgi:hypothetical protein